MTTVRTTDTAWRCDTCGVHGAVVHMRDAATAAIALLCEQQHSAVSPRCASRSLRVQIAQRSRDLPEMRTR